jgi:hypothetical protein
VRLQGSVLVLILAASCVPDQEDLPRPGIPGTVAVDWPWCSVRVPPIRDDSSHCPFEAVGETIEPKDVCSVLTALRDWVEQTQLDSRFVQPGDYERIESIMVCRDYLPRSPNEPEVRGIMVYADVPERPRLFWATLDEASSELSFGATHR